MRYSESVEDFYKVLNLYAEETLSSEKKRLLESLANFPLIQQKDELIRLAMYGYDPTDSGAVIRDQDVVSTILFISNSGDIGHEMAWSWARVHWSEFVERFSLNDRTFCKMAPRIIENYNTKEKLWEAMDFFDFTEDGAGVNYRKDAVESLKANIFWNENNLESIREWISEKLSS